MATYSPVVPIERDDETGFAMNSTIQTLLKQNFKMLLLTSPGERVMHPEFGVGIKSYLFEQFDDSTYSKIESRIRDQTTIYLPAIIINNIHFAFNSENMNKNQLGISISYFISAIGIEDSIFV